MRFLFWSILAGLVVIIGVGGAFAAAYFVMDFIDARWGQRAGGLGGIATLVFIAVVGVCFSVLNLAEDAEGKK